MKCIFVSLGLAREDLTLGAIAALNQADWNCLRTEQHAAASYLREQGIAYEALDHLYVESEDFESLNGAVATHLQKRLQEHHTVAYAVADVSTDATAQAVLAALPPQVEIQVLPGVGLAAGALAAATPFCPDFDLSQWTCLPALEVTQAHFVLGRPLLILELASRLLAGEVKLCLLETYGPEQTVLLLQGVGGRRQVRPLRLCEIDQAEAYDHTTALWILPEPLTGRDRFDIWDLAAIMQILRGPAGCPWDREQTHASLRPYLLEEAYEAVDAIDHEAPDKIADELGDVLLQIVFHAEIARQQGDFTLADITTAICRKMISRHAHIFGDVHCDTPEQVLSSWDAIKRRERGQQTTAETMRDVGGYLPALMRADKVQRKAARVGFDWQRPQEALEKVREETRELMEELEACGAGRVAQEGGDLLFAAVNVLRLAGVDPELALTDATEKFIRRFEAVENAVLAEGKEPAGMTLEDWDVYWERVKQEESAPHAEYLQKRPKSP